MFDPDAPNFKDIKTWHNSDPISIRNLHGKVALIDFWTYSCVNCVRTLPNIKMMHQKYKDRGLVVIGVHTPEFEFEKDDQNVREAIEKHGIDYPVANDHTNATWQLYGNKYWPRRALVNARGKIVLEQVGEGGEHDLELKIIELLHEAGDRDEFVIERNKQLTREDKLKIMDAVKRRTPEIYLGWERSEGFGNSAVCVPNRCTHFVYNGIKKENVVYLDGDWAQEKQSVHKEGKEEGYAVLRCTAREINAVMSPFFGKRHRVYVFMDGKPVDRAHAGRDIKIDQTGSFVYVDRPDMYELIDAGTMDTREVKIMSDSEDFTLYTLTFG